MLHFDETSRVVKKKKKKKKKKNYWYQYNIQHVYVLCNKSLAFIYLLPNRKWRCSAIVLFVSHLIVA